MSAISPEALRQAALGSGEETLRKKSGGHRRGALRL